MSLHILWNNVNVFDWPMRSEISAYILVCKKGHDKKSIEMFRKKEKNIDRSLEMKKRSQIESLVECVPMNQQ